MRFLLCFALVLSCAGCKSIDRLWRNSPMGEVEVDADRVNVWPLFYSNGEHHAVLWPIFDQDEEGFAVRPLLTKDGDTWELLPPLAYLDTESGDWYFIPAYSLGDSYGLFPVFGQGWLDHVGPVWWDTDDGELEGFGVFPLLAFADEFNHVGPAWWISGDEETAARYGLFPLFDVGENWVNVGPVVWVRRGDGGVGFMMAFPLFGYGTGEGGGGAWMSPLGGYGWDDEGNTSMINVLGPLYHHYDDGKASATAIAWPLITISDGERYKGVNVWPFFKRGTRFNAKGETQNEITSAVLGLYRHSGKDEVNAVRMLPLFSYRDEKGGSESLLEKLSLYGRKDYKNGSTAVHVGTPMVFNYRSQKDGYRWSSLLGTIQYQTRDAGEGKGKGKGKTSAESEFNLLWYLYRQRTKGTETRRDFFPFVTWDSGEKRSGFSFLWRLFSWQRRGDKTSGHVLFIPWGDR